MNQALAIKYDIIQETLHSNNGINFQQSQKSVDGSNREFPKLYNNYNQIVIYTKAY